METIRYDELKRSFKIVYENENYILLNDGEVYKKDSHNNLILAKDDEKTKILKRLMERNNSKSQYRGYYIKDDNSRD